ncbi:hypothetical protein [Amycolatopsis thermophila]|uniref:Uncharacterized protein n=1 Tax=Amycolatopsis thermophila TaxID=206084 RepID=A0ABU0ERB9_9PSEU|nr:hypothetical protein [Amycolatopsis thermophila]MDQ0377835.1 hypothetical protein [Amycolatopsis thermophila]
MGITYETVAAVLRETGLASPEHTRDILDRSSEVRTPLDPFEVARALEDFGAAVSVHADDVDVLEESYESLLRKAAALTGGAVTVSGVHLDDGADGDDVLHFERNGEPRSVDAEHLAEDYLDHAAAVEAIAALSPGDGRQFREVDFDGAYRERDTIVVLVTDEQREALRERLGLQLR